MEVILGDDQRNQDEFQASLSTDQSLFFISTVHIWVL